MLHNVYTFYIGLCSIVNYSVVFETKETRNVQWVVGRKEVPAEVAGIFEFLCF